MKVFDWPFAPFFGMIYQEASKDENEIISIIFQDTFDDIYNPQECMIIWDDKEQQFCVDVDDHKEGYDTEYMIKKFKNAGWNQLR
jgi:hypothetical protein